MKKKKKRKAKIVRMVHYHVRIKELEAEVLRQTIKSDLSAINPTKKALEGREKK